MGVPRSRVRGGLDQATLAEDHQPFDVLTVPMPAKTDAFASGLRAVEADVVAGHVFQLEKPFFLRDKLLLDEAEGGAEIRLEGENQVVVRLAADGDLQGAHAVLDRLYEADAAFGLASGPGFRCSGH